MSGQFPSGRYMSIVRPQRVMPDRPMGDRRDTPTGEEIATRTGGNQESDRTSSYRAERGVPEPSAPHPNSMSRPCCTASASATESTASSDDGEGLRPSVSAAMNSAASP